jgi:hypothetical protein
MLATPKDIQAAVVLVAVYGLFAFIGISKRVLDVVLSYPVVSRLVWITFVVFLLSYKYYLTATLIALIGLHISFNVRVSYVFSNEGILEMYRAAQENDPRFDKETELDVKMAEGTLTFDPARWRDPGRAPVPLLLFSPTPEQLVMAGSIP